jgi:hypothetical protein
LRDKPGALIEKRVSLHGKMPMRPTKTNVLGERGIGTGWVDCSDYGSLPKAAIHLLQLPSTLLHQLTGLSERM